MTRTGTKYNFVTHIVLIFLREFFLYIKYSFNLINFIWFIILFVLSFIIFQESSFGGTIIRNFLDITPDYSTTNSWSIDIDATKLIKYYGYLSLIVYSMATFLRGKIKFRKKVTRRNKIIILSTLLLFGYGSVIIGMFSMGAFDQPALIFILIFFFFCHLFSMVINMFVNSFIKKIIIFLNKLIVNVSV